MSNSITADLVCCWSVLHKLATSEHFLYYSLVRTFQSKLYTHLINTAYFMPFHGWFKLDVLIHNHNVNCANGVKCDMDVAGIDIVLLLLFSNNKVCSCITIVLTPRTKCCTPTTFNIKVRYFYFTYLSKCKSSPNHQPQSQSHGLQTQHFVR